MSNESESALERLFQYFKVFCCGQRSNCSKIVELFVSEGKIDSEAVSELTFLLGNRKVKNEILEASCGLSFRYGGANREILKSRLVI
jgi:hypothetical protein